MPTFFGNMTQGGIPNSTGMSIVRSFTNGESPVFEYPYSITGITKDSAGSPLGSCTVKLYRTLNDSVAGVVVSDASTGAFFLNASGSLNHYMIAYKPGSPDVAGTTINTLVGT
jgi:hypothetical protein